MNPAPPTTSAFTAHPTRQLLMTVRGIMARPPCRGASRDHARRRQRLALDDAPQRGTAVTVEPITLDGTAAPAPT